MVFDPALRGFGVADDAFALLFFVEALHDEGARHCDVVNALLLRERPQPLRNVSRKAERESERRARRREWVLDLRSLLEEFVAEGVGPQKSASSASVAKSGMSSRLWTLTRFVANLDVLLIDGCDDRSVAPTG